MAKKAKAEAAAPNVVAMPPSAAGTGELPGVEGPGVSPKTIPEIEKLADEYVIARDKRMALTEKEVAAKEKLAQSLHDHAAEIGKNPDDGSIRYVYKGGTKERRVITLKPSEEKLNVKDVEAFED